MINSNWLVRDCPLCSSENISKNPVISSSPRAEDLVFAEVKKYFIGLRENQIFISYYR